MDNPKSSLTEKLSLIFNGLLATVAVAGFIYSFWLNSETSTTLEQIRVTFETYTEPILKFDGFQYFYHGNTLSLSHPPIGMNFSFKNFSNFPIRVTNESLSVKYEGRDYWSETPGGDSAHPQQIVAPQERLAYSFFNHDFSNIFKDKKTGMMYPPYIEIQFDAIVSNLSQTKKYRVRIIEYIGVSSKDLQTQSIIDHLVSYERL